MDLHRKTVNNLRRNRATYMSLLPRDVVRIIKEMHPATISAAKVAAMLASMTLWIRYGDQPNVVAAMAPWLWSNDMRETLRLYDMALIEPISWWRMQLNSWNPSIVRRRCIEYRGQEYWDMIAKTQPIGSQTYGL